MKFGGLWHPSRRFGHSENRGYVACAIAHPNCLYRQVAPAKRYPKRCAVLNVQKTRQKENKERCHRYFFVVSSCVPKGEPFDTTTQWSPTVHPEGRGNIGRYGTQAAAEVEYTVFTCVLHRRRQSLCAARKG